MLEAWSSVALRVKPVDGTMGGTKTNMLVVVMGTAYTTPTLLVVTVSQDFGLISEYVVGHHVTVRMTV